MREDEDAAYYQQHGDDEGEWGEAVRTRSERRRLASMVSVRFSPEEADRVRNAASAVGRSLSDFIRQAALEKTGYRTAWRSVSGSGSLGRERTFTSGIGLGDIPNLPEGLTTPGTSVSTSSR